MSWRAGSRERGVRIPPQWIIAGILAAVGLFQYLGRTQINPITGEKQRVALSVQEEVLLGARSAPTMAAQMGGIADSRSQAANLVREVGKQLVEAGVPNNSEYEFHFHLLRDPDTVNAFALPGGQVFITQGLLGRLENEAQLAGVLGHEIGHVIHRHAAQHMAQGQLGQMLVTAVGVASSDGQRSGRSEQAVAAMVNSMVQLKYGRHDESQSDEFGLKAMAAAGYDPSQMLGVMRILASASQGNRQPEWLSSHPYPENRAQQIEQWLREKYPNGIPSELSVGRRFRSR